MWLNFFCAKILFILSIICHHIRRCEDLRVPHFYLLPQKKKKEKRLPHMSLRCTENLVFSSIYGNSTRNSHSHPISWFVIRKPYFIWTLVDIKANTWKLKSLRLQPYSIFFLLKMNFDKFTIALHFFFISSKLAKCLQNLKSIAMSSIYCLNCKFL